VKKKRNTMNKLDNIFIEEEDSVDNFVDPIDNAGFINPLFADGDIEPPKYFADSDGKYLFTPGLINLIYGLPGSRKSFLAQGAVLEHGGVFIDLETSVIAMKRRLKKMTYNSMASEYFAFPENYDDVKRLVNIIIGMEPTIVAIDSMGELVSRFKGSTIDDMDVARVFSEVLKPLARAGHCVIVTDHLPKSGSNSDFPYGSHNKKSQSDVLILMTDIGNASELKLTKDRHYIYGEDGFSVGQKIGYLEVLHNPTRIALSSYKPSSGGGGSSISKLKVAQDRVMHVLDLKGVMTKSQIRELVGGNNAVLGEAIRQLEIEGFIYVTAGRTQNNGNAQFLNVEKSGWDFSSGSHLADLK